MKGIVKHMARLCGKQCDMQCECELNPNHSEKTKQENAYNQFYFLFTNRRLFLDKRKQIVTC